MTTVDYMIFGSDFGHFGHSFGLSQFRGRGSWVVCEVTLIPIVVLGDWTRRGACGVGSFGVLDLSKGGLGNEVDGRLIVMGRALRWCCMLLGL